MAQIEIISETEVPRGWEVVCQLLDDAGGLHRVTVTLAWSDYNLWSADGSDEPSAVALAALTFLLEHEAPEQVPASFNAATLRRQYPDADAHIPRHLR